MATPSSAITRFELGTTFAEFDLGMNQKGFIGAQVLRPRVVSKNAADVGKIPLEQLLQSKSTKRNAGGVYARDTWDFDKYSYAVAEYGKEEPLDDSQLAMYGDIVDAETVSADRATDAVLGEYERDVASAVFNSSTWTGATLTTAITNEWDDFANATPINDVNAAIEMVAASSGLEANALVVNRKVLRNLLQCDEIVDRVKYTQTPTPSMIKNALADLFDLKYILVAGGFKNTANAGQDAAISRIWSDEYAMVCRIAESDDPREACIGRTFIWDGDGPGAPGDGGKLAVIMEEYREEKVRGSVLRARNNRDIVIMYAEAGHLLSNVTT
jgi:hypothetical protein